MRRAIPRAALLGAGLAAAFAAAAPAVIPNGDKIAEAIASANRMAGRATPLMLEVSLRFGEGEPVARGTLVTHPTGLARLELSTRHGIERHLLQGSDYRVSQDGEIMSEPPPWPLLAPVFLLQADSGATLRAALESFGVEPDATVLGRVGDRDCYVLGGRPAPSDERRGSRLPSLWIDLETLQAVRIDRADGARIEFGPERKFGKIKAPAWIAIEVGDRPPARLVIEKVARANAPAAAFGTDWLTTPPTAP